MTSITADRRQFLRGSGAVAAAALSLKYGAPALAQTGEDQVYGAWEDLMRQKWTWDSVVRGSRGLNCTGHCAMNVYVKNGIVWREEQQGEYGRSGDDTPDYGPRGCQKGLRHAKYMYGSQRVLYPMKRLGERGEGKWERISWDQAASEIADRFIDHAVADGPESISMAMGTQMTLKRASFSSLFRFANITGIMVPETFAGVGDLPVGAYMTLGFELPGDNMAAIFKSKVCLVWFCNPAATRIPDAHFFWEAKYNGTEVVAITPDFNATAMHASSWLNPKPGTDIALAMAMCQVIVEEGTIDWDYVREQTDLPFLVRTDNRKFLRLSDLEPDAERGDKGFYIWDESKDALTQAAATGFGETAGRGGELQTDESLRLGELRPAVEGRWTVDTANGPVEVTTVFELTREVLKGYTPELAQEMCGVHADNIRQVARQFAASEASMIFAGYRSCKFLHGDKLHRAWLLMCALTGNTGREGGGMQTTQLPNGDGLLKYAFNGVGPRLKIAAISLWDYAHANHEKTNRDVYGDEFADKVDVAYREAIENKYIPDYGRIPWKMGIMAGHNPGNWRATGDGWRKNAMLQLETIVTLTPNMSVTAMYSDYVLPIADHYERQDFVMEGRTPYVQVIDKAVAPLGDSVDDFTALDRLMEAISERAAARGIAPIEHTVFGQTISSDYSKSHDEFRTLYTDDRKPFRTENSADVAQYIIENSGGMSEVSYKKLQEKGMIRVDDADGVQFGPNSAFSFYVLARTRDKKPYDTLTGRQQFYFDHDWFLQEGEALPEHRDPIAVPGYKMRLTMGHARHGVHSMYRDDSLLVSLQRDEPDVFVNNDDASERGVADGDLVKVFNSYGSFIAQARVTAGAQPGTLFMYHGWDPMMFRGRENFSSAIPTGGMLKRTSLVGDYGHISYKPPVYVPNQTYHDATCEFEKHVA